MSWPQCSFATLLDSYNALFLPSFLKSRLSVTLFDFNFLVLYILKEADINLFFKVLAKFGDNKHNKDIKKKWEKNVFFPSKGVGGGG